MTMEILTKFHTMKLCLFANLTKMTLKQFLTISRFLNKLECLSIA